MKYVLIGVLVLASPRMFGQNSRPIPQTTVAPLVDEFLPNRPSTGPSSGGAEYRIGSDDLIEVAVFDAPDLGGTTRVSASGVISLPLIGAVKVAGLTQQELERTIAAALKEKYVNDPHVTVLVREYASQPVSVQGAVKIPGIYQLKGQRYLLEMLATAGGLAENSGKTIQVIRASQSDSIQNGTITIDAEDLFDNGVTGLNIAIFANDSIIVSRAGSVFILGEVVHPDEHILRNGKNITVMQAVGVAAGFTRDAKRKDSVLIRIHRDGSREEIPINFDKVQLGQQPDVEMLPDDILLVRPNKVKSALNRTMEATISVVTGRLIYSVR